MLGWLGMYVIATLWAMLTCWMLQEHGLSVIKKNAACAAASLSLSSEESGCFELNVESVLYVPAGLHVTSHMCTASLQAT